MNLHIIGRLCRVIVTALPHTYPYFCICSRDVLLACFHILYWSTQTRHVLCSGNWFRLHSTWLRTSQFSVSECWTYAEIFNPFTADIFIVTHGNFCLILEHLLMIISPGLRCFCSKYYQNDSIDTYFNNIEIHCHHILSAHQVDCSYRPRTSWYSTRMQSSLTACTRGADVRAQRGCVKQPAAVKTSTGSG